MASEEEKKAVLAYEHLEALEDESEEIELELREFKLYPCIELLDHCC